MDNDKYTAGSQLLERETFSQFLAFKIVIKNGQVTFAQTFLLLHRCNLFFLIECLNDAVYTSILSKQIFIFVRVYKFESELRVYKLVSELISFTHQVVP